MAVYVTPFVNVGVDTNAYTSGDALGNKSFFPGVPVEGVIHSIMVIDRDSENVNLDLVLFTNNIAGSAANAAFAPTDAELSNLAGSVLVNTWKTFSTNSMGIVTNIGLPYRLSLANAAPSGMLYFQCVTRGTPTFTAVTDLLVAIAIVY